MKRLSDAELVTQLRAGGLNVYFRHAETDWSQSDRVSGPDDLSSCDPARVRQLSAAGHVTARRIGRAIRALGLRVGDIVSSPYCRAVQTAQGLQLGDVRLVTTIMNLRASAFFGGEATVVARAQTRLSQHPAPQTNTVLVAHGNLARAATTVYPGEGGAVVVRPLGEAGFEVLGALDPSDWERLVELSALGTNTSKDHQ